MTSGIYLRQQPILFFLKLSIWNEAVNLLSPKVAEHLRIALTRIFSANQNSNEVVNISNVHVVCVQAAVHHVYGSRCKHANLLVPPWAEDKMCRSAVNKVQLSEESGYD